jgi:hypothetical protein
VEDAAESITSADVEVVEPVGFVDRLGSGRRGAAAWGAATRAYVQRRTTEGMSNRDIMRCLKRYIARTVYRAIQEDLAELAKNAPKRLDDL